MENHEVQPLAPLPETDVFPDFAVSLPEANRRVRQLQEFVREHMVEGEDYGVIPGLSHKPTLFKSGAEKLNAIFGLAPLVEIMHRVEDWENDFVSYEVKVTLLNKRSSQVEAEGVGSCNSRERLYRQQGAANVANTVLKMSKKRALIDATLSATRASGLFTQDLEDLESNHENRPAIAAVPHREARNGLQGIGRHQVPLVRPGTEHHTSTEAQRKAIHSMAARAYGQDASRHLERLNGKPVDSLSKMEASQLIDQLQEVLSAARSGDGRVAA